MHQGNPDISANQVPLRPDAARVNAAAQMASDNHNSRGSTIPIVTTHINSTHYSAFPQYATDMATAVHPFASMPNTGAGFSYSPLGSGMGMAGLDTVKRKRGRPRKYGPGSNLALSVTPLQAAAPSPSPLSPVSPNLKRGRGRPPGTGKNQQLAALGELMMGSVGIGFTPHAITVGAGEDIASRIMSFSQQGPRGICILSANGSISNPMLSQAAGGVLTYEGRFEILSLSGSFLLTECGGEQIRTGGLSVSLARPDGSVVGGGVNGVLMAASPVQVIVGSFICTSKKFQSKNSKNDGTIPNTNGLDESKVFGADSPVFHEATDPGVSSDTDSPHG